MGLPWPLFCLFSLFPNTKTINVMNDPSSMPYWDTNSQPYVHEHPPMTT